MQDRAEAAPWGARVVFLLALAFFLSAPACGEQTSLDDGSNIGDDASAADAPSTDDGSPLVDAACSPCGTRCVDLATDVGNCGGCNNHCPASQVCKGGQCTCTGNQTLCGAGPNAKCVDLMADLSNCGTCGNACRTNTTCQAGKCVCPGAETLCGASINAACTYLTNDHANCGGCGSACPPGGNCQNSACTCPAGQLMCGTGSTAICIDPATDHGNCGGCGMACASGSACVGSKCIPCASMAAGMMCGTPLVCVDTTTDRGNCGGCGNRCLPSQICQSGKCACPPGEQLCGSGASQACVVLSGDQNNCGACGVACTGGKLCQGSVCGCPAGYHNCSGTCLPDNSTSTSSCGTTCALCPTPSNGAATCSGTPPVCGQSCPGDHPKLCGSGEGAHCVNTTNDTGNCGSCGASCSTNHAVEKCENSGCSIVSCNPSPQFKDCDGNAWNGCEIDTSTDPNNCGGCSRRCNSTGGSPWCSGGSCGISCFPPMQDCNHNASDGCEVDTASDPNNCGGCGKACPIGADGNRLNCSGGKCSNCPSGSMLCGNACSSCPARPANGTLTCSGDGRCIATCNNPNLPTFCNGACVNTQTDQGNCGGCGTPCVGTNKCNQTYACQAGVCTGSNPVGCPPATDSCHVAGTCNPSTGMCSAQTQRNDGASCTGSNKCDTYACQGGSCVGTPSVACTSSDVCKDPGTCDPGTGVCSPPTPKNGTPPCTGTNKCDSYACVSGVCTGTNSVTCTASDGCHGVGTCDPGTGLCSNPPANEGGSCNGSNKCLTYTCVSGVCTGSHPGTCTAIDACHAAGTCDPVSGVCTNPPGNEGAPCPPGANKCNQSYACHSGMCTGSNPVTCTAIDACHAVGTCDPGTGTCSNPVGNEGAPCPPGTNKCNQMYTCQAGTCTGSNPVVCMAIDACHGMGTCDSSSGICSNPPANEGGPCTGTNKCFQTYTCQAGMCANSNPVMCAASDVCHMAGTCDPGSGQCSNPPGNDGATCLPSGTDKCSQTYTCQGGTCTGSNPVVCTASDQCHAAGTCDMHNGKCSNPTVPDGTACSGTATGTTCQNGSCTCPPNTSVCNGACVNKNNDPNNCGNCGTICGVPDAGGQPMCSNGSCAM